MIGADESLLVEGGVPPGATLGAVLGVISLLITILLIGLCAGLCVKASDQSDERPKPKRDSSKKKPTLKVDVGLARDFEAIDVDVVTPQTNGSVSTGSAQVDRPKSHDRALPEIPGVLDAARAAEDDDDEDNDGLYDVISKRPKRQAAQANGSVKPKASPEAVVQNPYELVPGDTDPQPVAEPPAASPEDTSIPIYSMPSKGPGYRHSQSASPKEPLRHSPNGLVGLRQGRGSSPIDLARQAFFAETTPPSTSTGFGGFSTRSYGEGNSLQPASQQRNVHSYERVTEVGASTDERSHGDVHRDGESVNTLNMSTSSVPPPPVPVKELNFDSSEAQVNSAHNSMYGQVLTSTSVPAGSAGASPLIGRAMQLISDDGAVGGCGDVASGDALGGFPGTTSGSGAAGPAKKEPPYHKVTVRESLASVRMREAEQNRLNPPPAALVFVSSGSGTDVDYDQINYDQIKSPGACGGTSGSAGGDTGSELYAEIGGAEVPSQRSSTYAAVGDGTLGDHAPTPPPVDSLKQLTETLDPGYSQIGNVARARPQSTLSNASNTQTEGATSTPLYAKVNKGKKPQKRQTLHGGEDLETMYAKVNKAKKNKAGSHDGTGSSEVTRSQSGARPKVLETNSLLRRPHGSSSGASRGAGSADPGYSTIEGAIGSLKSHSSHDYYEVVEDKPPLKDNPEIGSDYDPNYESMGNIARVPIDAESAGAQVPGVAMEIVPAGGGAAIDGSNEQGMVHVNYNDQSKQSVFDRPGLIREHIYQEINEAKKNSKRKGLKDAGVKEQKKNGRHSRKDSGSKKL